MQDSGTRPGNAIKDNQAKAVTRNVYPVAHRVCPQQAGVFFRTEDINQCWQVEAVHVLRKQRQAGLIEWLNETALDRAET